MMLLNAQTTVFIPPLSESDVISMLTMNLQSKSKEAFLEILDAAVMFNMPKLLACCEHHIAADICR